METMLWQPVCMVIVWIVALCLETTLCARMPLPQRLSFSVGDNVCQVTVLHADTYKMIFNSEGPCSDRSIIVHNDELGLTVYKDITTRTCFISPFYGDVVHHDAVFFKQLSKMTNPRSDSAITIWAKMPVTDVAATFGKDVSTICGSYPTYVAYKDEKANEKTDTGADEKNTHSRAFQKRGRIASVAQVFAKLD